MTPPTPQQVFNMKHWSRALTNAELIAVTSWTHMHEQRPRDQQLVKVWLIAAKYESDPIPLCLYQAAQTAGNISHDGLFIMPGGKDWLILDPKWTWWQPSEGIAP